jgi:hypothetical protein
VGAPHKAVREVRPAGGLRSSCQQCARGPRVIIGHQLLLSLFVLAPLSTIRQNTRWAQLPTASPRTWMLVMAVRGADCGSSSAVQPLLLLLLLPPPPPLAYLCCCQRDPWQRLRRGIVTAVRLSFCISFYLRSCLMSRSVPAPWALFSLCCAACLVGRAAMGAADSGEYTMLRGRGAHM